MTCDPGSGVHSALPVAEAVADHTTETREGWVRLRQVHAIADHIGRRRRTFPGLAVRGAGSSLMIEMQLSRSELQLVAELRVRNRDQRAGPLRKRSTE